ncbi:hypothetical protein ADL19_13530 [Streptomyces purpurogeneiscleroticus]|nr:hypothetical protein ADL19_13530 [Streptomyces purpurogeneiscleroticus]
MSRPPPSRREAPVAESSIEWTEQTWNPIVGCSVVSPGCTNCYAMRMAARLERMGQDRYRGLTRPSKAGAVWTGEMRFVDEALTLPLRRRKPTTWFVNSMSDLFHESVPDEWIDCVFAVMALTPTHTFQVLTKRAARMRAYLSDLDTPGRIRGWIESHEAHSGPVAHFPHLGPEGRWPLPNVWLGVSAEDQRRADERVPDLLFTPAAVRFVSAEPLLGPIDFDRIRIGNDALHVWNALGQRIGDIGAAGVRLDWVIVGGESGPGARPMHPDWARQIRDACAAADVAFHFKQHGAWVSTEGWYADHPVSLPIRTWTGTEWTDDGRYADREWVALIGKKAAGRLLDGVEHNGFPEVAR